MGVAPTQCVGATPIKSQRKVIYYSERMTVTTLPMIVASSPGIGA